MAYVAFMSSIKVGMSSPRLPNLNEISYDELKECELDFFEEMRDDSQIKLSSHQKK